MAGLLTACYFVGFTIATESRKALLFGDAKVVVSLQFSAPMPNDYSIFPVINATLNGTSAVLLVTAHSMIQRGRMAAHRAVMLTAVFTSSLFLASYLYYHWHVGSVRFQGHGWSRLLYFSILTSHTILAITILPLVVITLSRALRERFDQHRAIARWTYPLWLYVSVTGVVVYFMLYHLFKA